MDRSGWPTWRKATVVGLHAALVLLLAWRTLETDGSAQVMFLMTTLMVAVFAGAVARSMRRSR